MDIENEKKIISQIFNFIGAPIEEITYVYDEKRGHIFSVNSIEFEKLTAEREDLNRDLVYLIKRLFNRTSLLGEENFKCTVDINNFQSKIDAKIKIKALNAAEEARNLKTDVVMETMSSYERMVVHSVLTDSQDITTESFGQGRERRIKIKYLPI